MYSKCEEMEEQLGKSSTNLEGFRFSHLGIEAALKTFKLEKDTDFLKTLSPLGYSYIAPAQIYPYPAYIAILTKIVAKALPDLKGSDAYYEWGRRQYDGIANTMSGKVAFSVFRLVKIERALGLMVDSMNRDAFFGDRKLVQLGTNHVKIIWENDPGAYDDGFMLHCVKGVFSRFFETSKGINVNITHRVTGEFSFEMEFEWEKPA